MTTTTHATEHDNLRHWDDAARGVYEVWYLTWNDPRTDQGFWLRYITEAPTDGGPLRGELWFARFDPRDAKRTFGVHRRFAASAVSSTATPFEIAIAGSTLLHDRAHGMLEGDGHAIKWNLSWRPAAHTLRLLPGLMYVADGRAETTVQSPNPRVAMSGTLEIDGERISLEGVTMGQSHVWGKKHAYNWAWGHCADFPGAPDALLELLGVRLRRGGVTLPPMFLLALDLDGERIRLNQFRHVAVNRASWGHGKVEWVARSPTVRVEGELTCAAHQMVNAPYVDPDGTRLYCANTEIGDARVVVWKRGLLGWREHRRLVAPRRAHFELGTRERDASIDRPHVLVE